MEKHYRRTQVAASSAAAGPGRHGRRGRTRGVRLSDMASRRTLGRASAALIGAAFMTGSLLTSMSAAQAQATGISIANPIDGSVVPPDEKVLIETVLSDGLSAEDIQVVRYFLDGEPVPGWQDWSFPFSRWIMPDTLPASGEHQISIEAVTVFNEVVHDNVNIVVSDATSGTTSDTTSDSSTGSTEAMVSISAPSDGAELTGEQDVLVQTSLGGGLEAENVKIVEFFFNGEPVWGSKDWSFPFERAVLKEDLTPGEHSVTILARTHDGRGFEDQVRVSVVGTDGTTDSGAGDTNTSDNTGSTTDMGTGVTILQPADGTELVAGEPFDLVSDFEILPDRRMDLLIDGELVWKKWSGFEDTRLNGEVLTLGTHDLTVRGLYLDGSSVEDTVSISVVDSVADTEPTSDTGTDDTSTNDDSTNTSDPAPTPSVAGCEPDVTFGPGGDFDPAAGGTLNEAYKEVPAGGTLGILPQGGTVPDGQDWIWSKRTDPITICGVADHQVLFESSDGKADWATGQVSNLTVHNLETVGLVIKPNGPIGGDFHFSNMTMRDRNSECFIAGRNREEQRNPPHPTYYITMENVTFRRCGGIGDHTTYITTRNCVATFKNIRVETIAQTEGLRSLCRVNIYKDSYFANYVGDRATAAEWGATPVDFPACGAAVFLNNTFDLIGEDGGNQAVRIKPRRPIHACDMPGWDSEKMWDRQFWAETNAKPITDPTNPAIFPVFFANNIFRFTEKGPARSFAIMNFGTYPREAPRMFDPTSIYRAVPFDDPATMANDGWVERSVVFTANNDFIGWDEIMRNDSSMGAPPHEDSDPDALYPPNLPVRPWVQVGGDNEELDIELPDWWPTTCADIQATYTLWPEDDETIMGGNGMPQCR